MKADKFWPIMAFKQNEKVLKRDKHAGDCHSRALVYIGLLLR